MSEPKISVLIPMYNRKHYIEQCLDSALRQTFQDYEIIVRDDGSTDGSADFVAERYADVISSGKLKLRRNEKNIGEFQTLNMLILEARGKYLMFLSSDDLYLPHGLQHMYEVAEHFNADVVHETILLTTPPDGIIKPGNSLIIKPYDKNQVKEISVMSADPIVRFNEWMYGGIGIDVHHNITNRKFFMENDFGFETFGGNRLLALKWIMKAKIFVKTPVPFYVYRNSPDSQTRSKVSLENVKKHITHQIQLSRHLDEYFAKDDFFRDKKNYQYLARSHLFAAFDNFWINGHNVYKDGITPELHRAVEETFKKHFGDDAAFPTFLFHWLHIVPLIKPFDLITYSPKNK